METFSVKYRCEKFGRIFHVSCIWSNMSQLWIIRSNYFYSRGVFDRIYHVPDIFGRMCYMWHTLVNYRCEKLERIFHMWCFRSNVSQLCGELSLFFHNFTAVKYWIEFLTNDIYGRISYMWHILVKYICEKFGRIFHMWCILLNMWWLANLVKLFTSVKYSIIFLMFDIFSRNFTFDIFGKCRCEKFGRIFHVMFSVQYVTTCMNSIDFSTSVQYILEFLTFDIIGQTSYTWPYRRI